MKVLDTYIFTYSEIQNNLVLISYLFNMNDFYVYEKTSLYFIYKTDNGIFLKRPEIHIKNKLYKEVLIDITDNLGNFEI